MEVFLIVPFLAVIAQAQLFASLRLEIHEPPKWTEYLETVYGYRYKACPTKSPPQKADCF